MICLSCPNCAAELEFADDLVGFETACYACANPLKVPPGPVHPVCPPDPGTQDLAPPSPPRSNDSTTDQWRPDDSFGPSQEPFSSYRSQREPPMFHGGLGLGMGTRLLLGAMILGIGVVGLYLSGGGVSIYVDNGGEEPMIVTIDGKEETTIAPGQCAKIACPPGEKRLQVRCAQKILFDDIKKP